MPKVSETYNLKVLHPNIASEWHPSKNGRLSPQKIPPGSSRKIWWRCNKGHEWKATVLSRTKGNRCPHCIRKNLVKKSPIAESDLLKEWHPTFNRGITPNSLSSTFRKIWWLCNFGHEWKATVRSRLNGEGCPYCGQIKEPDHNQQSYGKSEVVSNYKNQPQMSFIFDVANLDQESYSDTDFRKEKRYPYTKSVMVESPRSNHIAYALMRNFSANGMCIDTDYPIAFGDRIIVRLKNEIIASLPNRQHTVVRWCNELSDDDGKKIGYSVGLQYLT